MENSQFILITKYSKIRRVTIKKVFDEEKLRVWLNNLLLGLKSVTQRFP